MAGNDDVLARLQTMTDARNTNAQIQNLMRMNPALALMLFGQVPDQRASNMPLPLIGPRYPVANPGSSGVIRG